jgi:hypothetical protein
MERDCNHDGPTFLSDSHLPFLETVFNGKEDLPQLPQNIFHTYFGCVVSHSWSWNGELAAGKCSSSSPCLNSILDDEKSLGLN